MMVKAKRALVCGAGGFIGGHLVRRLQREGFWVRGVDLKPHDFHPNESDEVLLRDLRSHDFAHEAVDGIDEVYQLAADMGGAGYVFTGEHDADIMHNSANINLNVLDAARSARVSKMFFASSACIYPARNQLDPNDPHCSEDSAYPADPDSEYGWEKLFSERLYLSYARQHGLNVRIARFHNVYGPCFDEATDVLTLDGWKPFSSISPNDRIASKSIASDQIEYVSIAAFQSYYYSGPMFSVEHSALSQLVTPDHALFATWPTTQHTSDHYIPPFARHIAKSTKWDRACMYFTCKAEWEGSQMPDDHNLPECKMTDGRRLHAATSIVMRDWFEFIGWYLSEGSSWQTPSNYTVTITQTPGCNADAIVALLQRMGFTVYVNGNNILVSNKQLHDAVQVIPRGAHNKTVPRWMLNAPVELLTVLYDALMAGDGNNDGSRYSTVSSRLADDVMEIAIKLGKRAWIGTEKRKYLGKEKLIFRIHICSRTRTTTKRRHRHIVNYSGMVYDVTLEKNHVMMTRRDGKPVWSGNCGSWRGGREKAPAAICRKVAEARDGGEIEVWGDGEQTRSFLYVDECIEGILRLMRSEFSGPVNIGSDEMVSINQLVNMITKIAGKHLTIKHVSGPLGVRGRNSDNQLIREHLGWAPSSSLYDGLVKTYDWIVRQLEESQ